MNEKMNDGLSNPVETRKSKAAASDAERDGGVQRREINE